MAEFPEVFPVSPEEVKLEVHQTIGRVTYLIFRQTHHGIPIYPSRIDFRFASNGDLLMAGVDVYPRFTLDPSPLFGADQALEISRQESGYSEDQGDVVVQQPQLFVYVRERGEDLEYHLAWQSFLQVHHADPTLFERAVSFYEIWVDAHTGEVLSIEDRVEEFPISGVITGMVKDVPYGTAAVRPLPHVRVSVSGVGETYTDVDGFYSIEAGTVPRTVTIELAGRFIDINASNVEDAFISTTVNPGDTLNIHFQDVNSIPGERDTYFHGNVVHDWMLSLDSTFTGADYSMPAAVNIGSEDPLWPCNAYWDGIGINMFSAGGGCSATDQMADVIYHEYQHGLTQFAYAPFSPPYESGMGEGFSDYTGMTIRNTPCLGDAFFGTPGSCLRYGENTRQWPAPECDGEVHCLGEITMGALWKMRQNLIGTYGDTLLGAAHSDTLFRWAMFGRPYTVPDLLLEILVADDDDGTLLNGTPHFSEITGAFAQHNVQSPIPEYGIAHEPLANTTDTSEPFVVTAVISSIYGEITVAELTYTVHGVSTTVPMTAMENDWYQAVIPAQPAGTIVEYYLHAIDAVGNEMYSPADAPDHTHFFLVGPLDMFPVVFSDDCEQDLGWQLGLDGDNAATGQWDRVVPIGTFTGNEPVQPGEDHTPEGTICFVTGNAPFDGSNVGENDVDDGFTTLLSPPFDLRGMLQPVLTYWRWYTNDLGNSPGQDVWLVQITSDGNTWVDLERTQVSENSWTYRQFLVEQYVPLSDSVRVRFIAEDAGAGSLVEAAVDDITIINGMTFDYLSGDLDFDGQLGITDVLLLVDIISNPEGPSGLQLFVGDLNNDNTLNILDVIFLVNRILYAP
jgi:hypothetical protein